MTAFQSHKDLPVQLLLANKPLKASVVIASFGSAQGLNTPVFDVKIETDANVPPPAYEKPLRYGKQPEIHHIFRPDPKSPPKIISLFFGLAVIATLPALLIGVSAPFRGCLVALLTLAVSGSPLAATSTTSPRPLAPRRSLTPPSSGRSWRWSLSFSCTTPAGTCSKCCRSLLRSVRPRCSAARRRLGRFRAGGLRGSAEDSWTVAERGGKGARTKLEGSHGFEEPSRSSLQHGPIGCVALYVRRAKVPSFERAMCLRNIDSGKWCAACQVVIFYRLSRFIRFRCTPPRFTAHLKSCSQTSAKAKWSWCSKSIQQLANQSPQRTLRTAPLRPLMPHLGIFWPLHCKQMGLQIASFRVTDSCTTASQLPTRDFCFPLFTSTFEESTTPNPHHAASVYTLDRRRLLSLTTSSHFFFVDSCPIRLRIAPAAHPRCWSPASRSTRPQQVHHGYQQH